MNQVIQTMTQDRDYLKGKMNVLDNELEELESKLLILEKLRESKAMSKPCRKSRGTVSPLSGPPNSVHNEVPNNNHCAQSPPPQPLQPPSAAADSSSSASTSKDLKAKCTDLESINAHLKKHLTQLRILFSECDSFHERTPSMTVYEDLFDQLQQQQNTSGLSSPVQAATSSSLNSHLDLPCNANVQSNQNDNEDEDVTSELSFINSQEEKFQRWLRSWTQNLFSSLAT